MRKNKLGCTGMTVPVLNTHQHSGGSTGHTGIVGVTGIIGGPLGMAEPGNVPYVTLLNCLSHHYPIIGGLELKKLGLECTETGVSPMIVVSHDYNKDDKIPIEVVVVKTAEEAKSLKKKWMKQIEDIFDILPEHLNPKNAANSVDFIKDEEA